MEIAPLTLTIDSKKYSDAVDQFLGLKIAACEAHIVPEPGVELWKKVPVSTMLTPYTELREILTLLAPKPGTTVVDLGAGYGRMAFVVHQYFPGVHFVGYEISPVRVEEGNLALARHAVPMAILEVRDLARQSPVPAEFYFVYDFGTRAAIKSCLMNLQTIARERKIVVCGRGRAVRDEIEREQPWLSRVVEPQHYQNFSIYYSG